MVYTYLHPQMVEWFNQWQNHPTKMGISDTLIEDEIRKRAFFRNAATYDADEKRWVWFFTSFLDSRIRRTEYRDWIVSHLGGPPKKGINHKMVEFIVSNFRDKFQQPFIKGQYSWHDDITFITQNNPPTYPHIKGREIAFINWMWDSPFTLK